MQCAVENKKIYHNNDYLERRDRFKFCVNVKN